MPDGKPRPSVQGWNVLDASAEVEGSLLASCAPLGARVSVHWVVLRPIWPRKGCRFAGTRVCSGAPIVVQPVRITALLALRIVAPRLRVAFRRSRQCIAMPPVLSYAVGCVVGGR